ncbi:RagB/SusD domain-containing protein [Chitinophaga sp. CF118]|uniref:RagB/SusD family nutrient uptake outer membrane protein n=2 Tax=Pseudomonadati TaxID=3379134 RepID=UPI0008E6F038|nr:RagB/SusD family nutrient uptake outer membrane protein [Chitinophaga sp. CF118]SFE45408.1 RagB/SusD domain-containing protein [Chitinophaga sp. CF118]
MKQLVNYISCVLFVMLLVGCEKFTHVDGPPNKIANDEVFKHDTTAIAAVTGIYSRAMIATTSFLNGGITMSAGLSADEFIYNGSDPTAIEFFVNSIESSNSFIKTNLWYNAYSLVYQTNACIEGLNASKGLSSATKNQLLGESHFIRALIYFNLINLFGDVPLVLKTDYVTNATLARSSTTIIKSQMKDDLTIAINLLSPAYPTINRVRPNKWAATGLLARIHLYGGNWAEAENAASQVINSGNYFLEKNLNNVFVYNSEESIFQFMPVSTGYNTTEGNMFVPTAGSSTIPLYSFSGYQLNAFEPGDKRLSSWINNKTVGGVQYTYPYKYKLKADFDPNYVPTEYYIVLRLAEQYLIRSEARANQENLTGAVQDLDSIRSRAGLPLVSIKNPSISKEELLVAIQKERQTELFAEWGHRWFDLKRTQEADAILKNRKQGWNVTDTLYPIPSSERALNKNLTQNPGYN